MNETYHMDRSRCDALLALEKSAAVMCADEDFEYVRPKDPWILWFHRRKDALRFTTRNFYHLPASNNQYVMVFDAETRIDEPTKKVRMTQWIIAMESTQQRNFDIENVLINDRSGKSIKQLKEMYSAFRQKMMHRQRSASDQRDLGPMRVRRPIRTPQKLSSSNSAIAFCGKKTVHDIKKRLDCLHRQQWREKARMGK